MLQKPAFPASSSSQEGASSPPPQAIGSTAPSEGIVTIEYQRQQAKAMQQYFQALQMEQAAADSQVFGWTRKNEILNGRWVMMGFAVGLLTEYATAVNFIDQIKLMLSYLGIVDLDY